MRSAWSSASSTKWSRERPALGQCSPTALVVQDFFGGKLLKTRIGEAWHFYNEIEGSTYDFTAEQFHEVPKYLDLPTERGEVLSDCTQAQYRALFARFAAAWPKEKPRARLTG